jgi:hypothetical protein
LAALAGTFGELVLAASRGAMARRAVFVLTHTGDWLSDADRDELWRVFQVPVYMLLVTRDGRVVAWECEAQDGLHITEGGKESTCACGRPGAKLTLPRPLAHAAD